MSSGKRSGFGDWDKANTETISYDVGLGLRLQHQHQTQVYSNSGEGMTFTTNQRQELERQTMIYKYIMSSIPIPHELITSLTKTNYSSSPKGLELRYSSGSNRGGIGVGKGDLEPWRCRRTDGKKWRCSRDVVSPDQKYCERHTHKGRPKTRSRKPVESSSLIVSPTPITTTTTTTTTTNHYTIGLDPFQHCPSYDLSSSIPQYNNLHNSSLIMYPEWFMKEQVTVPATQVLYPQRMEQFSSENRGHSHSYISNLSPENDQTTCPLPRRFIDAWSLEDVHKVADTNLALPTEVTDTNNCPHNTSSMKTILPLALSMSAGFGPENIQNNAKGEDTMATGGVRPWMHLPSGGPLGEALCVGMSGTNNAWGSHSDELASPQGHSNSSTNTSMSSKRSSH